MLPVRRARRPGRRRRHLITLAAALAIAIIWLASAKWNLWGGTRRGFHAEMLAGQLTLHYWNPDKTSFESVPPLPGVFLERNSAPMLLWRPEWWVSQRGLSVSWSLSIPLWPLVLALLALGAWQWRRARLHAPGACPRCHYELRGLPPDSPCPECGEPNSSTPRPA